MASLSDVSSGKPLPKLVLKVGKEKKAKTLTSVAENSEEIGDSSHHNKKKKKKHKHSKVEETDKKGKKREFNETIGAETPVKKVPVKRQKKVEKIPKEPELSQFQLCLESLHRTLQRKDVYNIFSLPVTDIIAPGYSKIIKIPMDFLTMQRKIEDNEYSMIDEFRGDFMQMCNNAMLYNGSDTIYYKNAEKMLIIGQGILSNIKVKKLNKSLGIITSDSESTFVHVEDSSEVTVDESAEETKSQKKRISKARREEQSIIENALKAAREAHTKLVKKYPKQKYGYISKDESGNPIFNDLNQDISDHNKVMQLNLQTTVPRKSSIGNHIAEEEQKNRVVSINSLWYGPFGSFGPSHDTSLSSLNNEENNLLMQACGTDLGVAYSKSISKFSIDSLITHDYVDRLLDSLTEGAHTNIVKQKLSKTLLKEPNLSENSENKAGSPSKTSLLIEEEDEDTKKEEELLNNEQSIDKIDFNSLVSLGDLGIDVSFLKGLNQSGKT